MRYETVAFLLAGLLTGIVVTYRINVSGSTMRPPTLEADRSSAERRSWEGGKIVCACNIFVAYGHNTRTRHLFRIEGQIRDKPACSCDSSLPSSTTAMQGGFSWKTCMQNSGEAEKAGMCGDPKLIMRCHDFVVWWSRG